MSIVNVSKSDVVGRLAHELRKVADVKPPSWSVFVKTGAHVERPPTNPDWWFIRTASILTKLDDLGPVGVAKLRVKYGGKRNRGMAPERFKRSSGKILRLILQQLEKAGLAKQAAKGLHKGRVLTPKGKSFVEKVAYQIMKEENIVLPSKVSAVHQTAPVAAPQPVSDQSSTVPESKSADVIVKKPRTRKSVKKKEEASVAEAQPAA